MVARGSDSGYSTNTTSLPQGKSSFEDLSRHRVSSKKQSAPAKYGLPEFEDLETSTRTVMVYTNVLFNLLAIFHDLQITEIDVPLTKKQKNVDKKKIEAPYGAIVSVQSSTKIRGIDIRKKSKHWCTICRPIESRDSKQKKILTVTEELFDDENESSDVKHVKFYCSECDTYYNPSELKKINHFLNQLTVVISIEKKPLLNVMLFKDNLKIAGCKDEDDAPEVIMLLWEEYIKHIPNGWKLKEGEEQPKFIFDGVMRNVDFKLGFNINREALNNLMNSDSYTENVFMSQFESTNHTNVNIKMYSKRPETHSYDRLVLPKKGNAYFESVKENIYKNPKKKEKDMYVTFIVFSSSEIILSGRFDEIMKRMYEFFIEEAFKNKDLIEEKLREVDQSIIESPKKKRKAYVDNTEDLQIQGKRIYQSGSAESQGNSTEVNYSKKIPLFSKAKVTKVY